VLTLPTDLAKSFRDELIAYEGEKNMPYVTSIERNGEIRIIIRLLNRLVGQISQVTITKIEELPIEQLEQLGEDLLDFKGFVVVQPYEEVYYQTIQS
jgi:Domain of unknown function (DUF4351)